jgi:hypothetical protein
MLQYVQRSCRIGRSINFSFISLIPKEANPYYFSRHHPISLCNASYKIMENIIANILKELLPKIVSYNQGGFMQKQ